MKISMNLERMADFQSSGTQRGKPHRAALHPRRSPPARCDFLLQRWQRPARSLPAYARQGARQDAQADHRPFFLAH
jgi:hypothetical protein